ncbi:MAG: choice-of-anchor D domain-containing protein [Planctomycetota bacterium]
MAVGQEVRKFVWLLDGVEVKGTVKTREGTRDKPGALLPEGAYIYGDSFQIEPDDNYKHLVSDLPGSAGVIHVETYPLKPETINRSDKWDLEQRADGELPFKVCDGSRHVSLQQGHRIRVTKGWWVIENGHLVNTSMRGWLKIGYVFPELHPFDYKHIELIPQRHPSDVEEETVSVAAPLYEQIYPGKIQTWAANWWAGVANRVFISDDRANYHETVTANAYIQAPHLPAGFLPDSALICYHEHPLKDGGEAIGRVRSLRVLNSGLLVVATVKGSDVEGPARNESVFQARYEVRWKSGLRIPGQIQVGAPAAGQTTDFEVAVLNYGSQRRIITSYDIVPPDAHSTFQVTIPGGGVPVDGWSKVSLRGTFTPSQDGTYSARLTINGDPPGDRGVRAEVDLRGVVPAFPLLAAMPSAHDFGAVQLHTAKTLTFRITNTGLLSLNISAVELMDPTVSAFSITASLPIGTPIAPGEEKRLRVRFAPASEGEFSNQIRIASNAQNAPALLALSGEGRDLCDEIDRELADFQAQLDDPLLTPRERLAIFRRSLALNAKREGLGCP